MMQPLRRGPVLLMAISTLPVDNNRRVHSPKVEHFALPRNTAFEPSLGLGTRRRRKSRAHRVAGAVSACRVRTQETVTLLLQIQRHGFADEILECLLVDLSPSLISMARRTFPSRLELKSPVGSQETRPCRTSA